MSSLQPGDVIVFHGIVGGQRGLCLVVSVAKGRSEGLSFTKPWATVMTSQCKLYGFDATDPEDVFWSRISEREAA